MTPKQTSATVINDWQRLSPVSIIYFIIKFTITAVKQWFVNFLPAIAAIAVFADNKIFWLSIIMPTLALLIIIFSFLYYWSFRFMAKDGEILIHRGVIRKERLNLRYDRVQNVNIATPFYYTPFKLVNCVIESAGSKTTEVELPGVNEAFALTMRSEVFMAEQKVGVKEEDKQLNDTDTSEPMLKISNWESAKSGLTSYFAFIVMAAFAPFLEKFGGYATDNIFPFLMDIVRPVVGNPVASAVVIVFSSALFFCLLITSASVLGAFIRYHNFELYDSEDKLVRVAGLLERRSTTLTKIKVQSIWIKQNLIARLLNRVSIQYRQVGVVQGKASDASIQIPMLIPTEVKKLTSVVFSDCPEPEFLNIHLSYMSRVFFYFWLLPFALIVSVPIIFLSNYFLLALIALVPIFVLLRLRYRRYGFWFNEEFGAIRQGLFGYRIVVFPLYKVQITKVRQSRGQKKRHVGNLQVQLGSGSVSIPYLPIELLNNFVNLALYKTESSQEAWI